MAEQRESRPGANRTANNESLSTSVPVDEQTRAGTHLIGASVEKALDSALWRLVAGEIGLHELTPALSAWYSIGYAHGVDSCKQQIARLEHEADRLWLYAHNPRDRADIIRKRMDKHFADEWEAFVEGGAM